MKCVLFVFSVSIVISTQAQNKYQHFLDSADANLSRNPDKSISYLKKIPGPIQKTFKGHLAEYYETMAFAYYHKDNFGFAYRNMLLSAKYAEKEKKFKMAGGMYVEAFTLNRQIEKKPNEALLEKAMSNFKRVQDQDGILEVIQARIYSDYVDNQYKECIAESLKHLEDFKKGNERYTELVANYLLSSAYFRSDSVAQGMKYFDAVRTFNKYPSVGPGDFTFHITSLNFDLSNYYQRSGDVDSSLFYFKLVMPTKNTLDYTLERDYYELGAKIYRTLKKPELVKKYQDSLTNFEFKQNQASLKESLNSNENLFMATEDLEKAKSTSKIYFYNMLLLILVAVVLFLLLCFYRAKIKSIATSLKDKMEDAFSHKTREKKLASKVRLLEDYIKDIKSELKDISNEDSVLSQRNKLQHLYTDINLKLNQFSDQDQLHVLNEMNEGFFENLKSAHPNLSESESLICYYLSLGFKNKEIAAFLESTVRSVEGRRFRLIRKLNLDGDNQSTIAYLHSFMREEERSA